MWVKEKPIRTKQIAWQALQLMTKCLILARAFLSYRRPLQTSFALPKDGVSVFRMPAISYWTKVQYLFSFNSHKFRIMPSEWLTPLEKPFDEQSLLGAIDLPAREPEHRHMSLRGGKKDGAPGFR